MCEYIIIKKGRCVYVGKREGEGLLEPNVKKKGAAQYGNFLFFLNYLV